jgi:hypothetical protein
MTVEIIPTLFFSWLLFKVWVVDWRIAAGRMESVANSIAAEAALRRDGGSHVLDAP